MTLSDLYSKRDEILQTIGTIRVTHGERSIEYQDQEKALRLVDAEIARVSGAGSSGVSFVKTGRG